MAKRMKPRVPPPPPGWRPPSSSRVVYRNVDPRGNRVKVKGANRWDPRFTLRNKVNLKNILRKSRKK